MDLLSNRSIICISLLIVLLSLAYNHCSWECLFKLLSFLPCIGSRFSSIPNVKSDVKQNLPETPINRPPSPVQEPVANKAENVPAKTGQFGRIFSEEELAQYTGEKGLYLAVLGIVYDVQKGERFYAKGKAYQHFAGRDASRAFVTGDFSKDGLRDDVLDLKPEELLALQKWVQTYEKDYASIGRLSGRYYDEKGRPTEYAKNVEKAIEGAQEKVNLREERKKQFPPCNSEWIQETGGKVWCKDGSGGINRGWNGVPRQLFEPENGKTRCACVPETELSNPNLKEYPNCDVSSDVCATA